MNNPASGRGKPRLVPPAVAPFVLLGTGVVQYVGSSIAVGLFAVTSALTVGWGRLVWGAILLLLWRRRFLRLPNGQINWRGYGHAALFGVVLGGMNLAFYLAIDRIALGTAVALEFLGPVLLAALTGRGWRVRTGIVLACAGVFLISWAGVDISDPVVAWGVAFSLVAGVLWAFYMWLGRRVAVGGQGLDTLAWAMACAAIIYTPVGIPGIGPLLADWKLLVLLVVVGFMSSVVPYGMDQVLLRSLSAATFALLNSLLPVTSLVVGLVMLKQVPTPGEISGLVLVSVAVALATAPGAKPGAKRE